MKDWDSPEKAKELKDILDRGLADRDTEELGAAWEGLTDIAEICRRIGEVYKYPRGMDEVFLDQLIRYSFLLTRWTADMLRPNVPKEKDPGRWDRWEEAWKRYGQFVRIFEGAYPEEYRRLLAIAKKKGLDVRMTDMAAGKDPEDNAHYLKNGSQDGPFDRASVPDVRSIWRHAYCNGDYGEGTLTDGNGDRYRVIVRFDPSADLAKIFSFEVIGKDGKAVRKQSAGSWDMLQSAFAAWADRFIIDGWRGSPAAKAKDSVHKAKDAAPGIPDDVLEFLGKYSASSLIGTLKSFADALEERNEDIFDPALMGLEDLGGKDGIEGSGVFESARIADGFYEDYEAARKMSLGISDVYRQATGLGRDSSYGRIRDVAAQLESLGNDLSFHAPFFMNDGRYWKYIEPLEKKLAEIDEEDAKKKDAGSVRSPLGRTFGRYEDDEDRD
jgi:hypothetical protein